MQLEVREVQVCVGPSNDLAWKFTIPVLVNNRKVQAGDEVTVAEWLPTTNFHVKRIAPSEVDGESAKRAKTSK